MMEDKKRPKFSLFRAAMVVLAVLGGLRTVTSTPDSLAKLAEWAGLVSGTHAQWAVLISLALIALWALWPYIRHGTGWQSAGRPAPAVVIKDDVQVTVLRPSGPPLPPLSTEPPKGYRKAPAHHLPGLDPAENLNRYRAVLDAIIGQGEKYWHAVEPGDFEDWKLTIRRAFRGYLKSASATRTEREFGEWLDRGKEAPHLAVQQALPWLRAHRDMVREGDMRLSLNNPGDAFLGAAEQPPGVEDALEIEDVAERAAPDDPAWATFAREFSDGEKLLVRMEEPGAHAPAAIRWLVLLEGMSANVLPNGSVVFTMPSVERIQRASAAEKLAEAKLAVQLALKKMRDVASKHGVDLAAYLRRTAPKSPRAEVPPEPSSAQAPAVLREAELLFLYRAWLDSMIELGEQIEHGTTAEAKDFWLSEVRKGLRKYLTSTARDAALRGFNEKVDHWANFFQNENGQTFPHHTVNHCLPWLRTHRSAASEADMRIPLGDGPGTEAPEKLLAVSGEATGLAEWARQAGPGHPAIAGLRDLLEESGLLREFLRSGEAKDDDTGGWAADWLQRVYNHTEFDLPAGSVIDTHPAIHRIEAAEEDTSDERKRELHGVEWTRGEIEKLLGRLGFQ